jgi:hypothetical protein
MRSLTIATALSCGIIGLGALGAAGHAQPPCSVLSGHPCHPSFCSVFHHGPCHPSFCSVFHHGPCFPYYLPPLGETLQLTIVSTNDNEPLKPAGDADKDAEPHALDTIREMFTALRGCWAPPPKDEARHGMEYTIRFAFKRDGELIAPPRMTYSSPDAPADVRGIYRDAIDAALKRCTPLHFSKGMGGAIAGRPIAIRFVDDRTSDIDRDAP